MVLLIKLGFRQSNIVCIGILHLLIVKTNSPAISFSGSDGYIIMCFFKVCIAVFFMVVRIISDAVTYKDYHSQSDRLSS